MDRSGTQKRLIGSSYMSQMVESQEVDLGNTLRDIDLW